MEGKILESLFPKFVVTEETNLNASLGNIYPEEEIFIQNVAPKRKIDFVAGRVCARKALSRLGIDKFPIIMSKDRSPIWPEHVVGTISHTQGYCGAAVALKSSTKSVGLDIECVDRLNNKCWYLICTDQEHQWIKSLPKIRQNILAALIFSAKECFYKCQYPVSQKWAGFHDAVISLDHSLNEGEFEIKLIKDISTSFAKGNFFKGKYVFYNRFVFAGMALEI